VSTVTAQTTQVYSVYIKATPEQIWEAITTPEFTERYFHGVRMEIRDGRRWSTLRELAWDEEVLGRPAPPPRARVDIRLRRRPRRRGAEPRHVVHDRLEGAPKTAASVAGVGWMFVLSNLKTLLETGDPL
jgi:hypothetical protein